MTETDMTRRFILCWKNDSIGIGDRRRLLFVPCHCNNTRTDVLVLRIDLLCLKSFDKPSNNNKFQFTTRLVFCQGLGFYELFLPKNIIGT
jgi:hypothetical protein